MEPGVARRSTALAKLLAAAEVRVDSASGGGSGFFVAPQTVVTCAHVVGGRTGATVEVGWRGNVYEGEVVGCRPEAAAARGQRYPHPDLAVLRVAWSPDHPCALLDPLPPAPGDELLVLGHTESWRPGEALAESETFRWSGQLETGDDGGTLMKIGAGQAVPGMSGGPVLNLRTGGVCGVLRTSRDPGSDLGGWVVPARTLRAAFPGPADAHDHHHRRHPDWRAVAERWADVDAAVFQPRQELAAHYPPSFLLRSEFELVPFLGRTGELAELTAWCTAEDRTAVGLVTGPGGQGKTRLARELCARLGGQGWAAGFLRPDVPHDELARLLAREAPCLLVIDYAETVADRVRAVAEAAARSSAGRVRLLLLARSAGDWWAKLREDAGDAVAALLLTALELQLAPIAAAAAARRDAFEQARNVFAARLGADPARVPPPPDLDHPRYGLALTLHMTALALVLDGAEDRDPRPTWQDPAARVLDHERRYWRRSAEAAGLPLADGDALGHVVTAATLFGAADREAAERLLAALPDLSDQPRAVVRRYAKWAGELHPGPALLNALQPDRLGEDHVAAVLPDLAGPLADSLMPAADDAQARQALTVLARSASRHGHAAPVLEQLLAGDPERLVPVALTVATQVREPQPLADAIEAALPSLTDPDALFDLWELLPHRSVALADLAVWIRRSVVARLRELGAGDDPNQGPVLNNLAVSLAQVGEHEEALAAAERAVELLRPAVGDPAYRGSLAVALNTLGDQLVGLGRLREARDAFREAIAIHEESGSNDRHLGGCLGNLAQILAKLGEAEEAVIHGDRAVQIFRGLDDAASPESQADLAIVLGAHTNVLAKAGRYDRAAAAGAETVAILRPLATARPDAFRVELGKVLDTLAGLYGRLGRFAEALLPAREAAGVFRELVVLRPGRYEPELHLALSTYAGILLNLGRGEAAFDTLAEAVAICRSLIGRRPDGHLDALANDVANLAIVANQVDRGGDALAVLRDVETQLRELAEKAYGPRRDALAAVLAARGSVLRGMGRHREAVTAGEEAVAALRAGGVRQPELLAQTLAFLAVSQVHAGRLTAGTGAIEEALGLCAAEATVDELVRAKVANCVNALIVPLVSAGRHRDAEAYARKAVATTEELAARNPFRELDLATALHNHAVALLGTGRLALGTVERAVDIRRRWADRLADAKAGLVRSLRLKALLLRDRNAVPQAEAAEREADALERGAPAGRPPD